MTRSTQAPDLASRAFHGSWRWLAATSPTGVLAENDGVLVAATGLPDPTLNPSYVVAEPTDPCAALQWGVDARAHLPVRCTGVDIPDGRWPQVESALQELGFGERVRRSAMTVAVDSLVAPSSTDLDIREVRTEADWSAYVDIQHEVFGITPEVARRFPPYDALAEPRVSLFVGAAAGAVVATAALFVTEDVAGLYAVGTAPAHRRRGFGAAITAHAVATAARCGVRHVALQASAEGYPLYRELGFADIGDWVVYVDPVAEPATGQSG